MIKNRGLAKKWTGMMITEHVHQLKAWQDNQEFEYPKEKTDWELDDLQQAIVTAYRNSQVIELRIWKEKWLIVEGKITALKTSEKMMLVETAHSIKQIQFHEVDRVRVIES